MIKTLGDVLRIATRSRPFIMTVTAAQDEAVLAAVHLAAEHGLVKPLLVDDKTGIVHIAQKAEIELGLGGVIDVPDKESACMETAELIRDKKTDMLMKGMMGTGLVMHAVLDKENSLRKNPVINHVAVIQVPGSDRLFYVTDSAMNVVSTLEQKATILKNAVEVTHALGNEMPRAAVLCAMERVDPKVPCTLDVRELARQDKQGDTLDYLVDGPLALDNTISVEAARHKGVDSPMTGHTGILLVLDIGAGNMSNKTMKYFANTNKAGAMIRAKVPIILASRTASSQSKLYFIVLGVLIVSKTKEPF